MHAPIRQRSLLPQEGTVRGALTGKVLFAEPVKSLRRGGSAANPKNHQADRAGSRCDLPLDKKMRMRVELGVEEQAGARNKAVGPKQGE
jgi:hypothetical protein